MLESGRLKLREIRDEDFDAVHAYASDLEVVRFMTWGPNTEQDTRDFLTQVQASRACEPRRGYEFGVEARDAEALMGVVSLHLTPDERAAELGYCYQRDAWGRGVATEAAEAILAFGFDVLHLHRVSARCDPENAASARVLQKVGMTQEGLLREDVTIRGTYRDTLVFGLLEHEWAEREKA